MTFIELYSQRITALENRSVKAKAALESARAALDEHKKKLAYWTDRADAIGSEIKVTDASLKSAATAADIELIAAELRELRIEERASLGRIEEYQLALQTSAAHVDSLVKEVEYAASESKKATDDLQRVTELDEKHQEWFAALAVDPLASAPGAADALLSGAVDQALDRLDTEFGADFMALVAARAEQHWERVDELGQNADTQLAGWDANWVAQNGFRGNIETKTRVFDAAVATVGEFLANAEALLDSAGAKAETILDGQILSGAQKARFDALLAEGDVVAEVLTPESNLRNAQHDLIMRQRELDVARAAVRAAEPDIADTELNDHATVEAILDGTDGKASLGDMQTAYDNALDASGLPLYDDLLEKESDLAGAIDALESATDAFLEDNPDADPESEASLDDARDAVSDAQTALESATAALRQTPWYKLEQLEVVIPNATWRAVLHLLAAKRDLTRLKAVDTGDLQTALVAAEDQLASAIAEDRKASDGFGVMNELVERFSNTAELTLARGTEAAFGAVRGLL